MANQIIDKALAFVGKNIKQPFRVVRFEWVNSPSVAATGKLGDFSASSAAVGSIPSGYTFVCWIQFISKGWVGTPYPENPQLAQTAVWTPMQKPSTTGTSLAALALCIRNDLA